jgi:hypothetical protein
MTQHEKQTLFHTTNLKTATALVTLGFTKISTSIIVRTDGQESMVFWFNPANADGLSAMSVFQGMTKGGEALSKSDPENVVNYLRSYAANRDELVNEIRNIPRMVEVRKGDKSALINEGASKEQKENLAKLL